MKPEDYAKTSEHSHQVALFIWAHNNRVLYPELRWMHAIHNQGHGDAVRGGKAKAEGVRAGVWDIFLPYPMNPYNGLYIEMKAPGKIGSVSDDQKEFGSYASGVGYATRVCDSWEMARDTVLMYLRKC